MPKINHIAWIHLQGGPLDGNWIRMEGEIHPSIMLFGDHEDPDATLSAYACTDTAKIGHYHDYQFTGQIDMEVIPPFLWIPDPGTKGDQPG